MQQADYDIGVIGGGLGGLCYALLCADAGYSTVLFEKETYPFHKVCGEYISNESYGFLTLLGLALDEWNLPQIKKLMVSNTSGKQYHFPLDLGGFGISRYTIDNALYKLALAKGVAVFTDEKVNSLNYKNDMHFIHTNKRNITTKVLAGAYGKRSNIDVQWKRSFVEKKPNKLNNYIGVKYHVKTNFPKDEIALHNFKNGYCGISAIEDDKYCLCYLTNANNLSANNNSIQQMEENLLYNNTVLKNIFRNADFLYNTPQTIAQISFEQKTQVENHALMLGDAAGLITPLCGNGMSMAMHSAKLAFTETCSLLQKKITREAMERNYINNWQKAFSHRLSTGRAVQKLMGNTTYTDIFLKLMHALPIVSRAIIRSTHGQPF